MRTLANSLGAALTLIVVSTSAIAGKSVTVGKVYPIAEPDTMEEIKSRAAAVDWRAWMRKTPTNYGAFDSVSLPRATETRSRLFDPTYFLPDDIRDANGKLIAAKGMPINVLQRIKLPNRYIVISDTPEDLRWLREVAKPVSGDKILLAGGNVYTTRQSSGLSVFMLDSRFIERFGLQAVPSIVKQEGVQLRVDEYAIDQSKGKKP